MSTVSIQTAAANAAYHRTGYPGGSQQKGMLSKQAVSLLCTTARAISWRKLLCSVLAIAIGADGSSLQLYSSYENGMGRKETDKAAAGNGGSAAARQCTARRRRRRACTNLMGSWSVCSLEADVIFIRASHAKEADLSLSDESGMAWSPKL